MASAVHANTRENVEAVQATKIQQLNWWGFGLELYVMITQKYIQEFPEIIELLNEKQLNIFVAGRPPACNGCGQKWHIKNRCP